MGEAVVVALLVAFPLAGLVIRRWPALALPAAGWPLFYVGLNRGWWLDGTGDGWEAVAVAFGAIGVATTTLAVAIGRRLAAPA